MRRACAWTILSVFVFTVAVVPSSAAFDEDLATGIRQVKEGDFETAVPTLEGVVRKLATEPGRSKELAQVYLYLGIAHVGLDHRGAAKENFWEAMRADKDLRLKEGDFSPKVIGLFNEAKQDAKLAEAQEKKKKQVGTQATPPPAPAPGAPAGGEQKAAQGKGGSKKWIFLAGTAAAGGVGVALLAKPFDFTKFYGHYRVDVTSTTLARCTCSGEADLTLSGGKDGSNFLLSDLSGCFGRFDFRGTIQDNGTFRASTNCFTRTCTFTGQTTGSNINGTFDSSEPGFSCGSRFAGFR